MKGRLIAVNFKTKKVIEVRELGDSPIENTSSPQCKIDNKSHNKRQAGESKKGGRGEKASPSFFKRLSNGWF